MTASRISSAISRSFGCGIIFYLLLHVLFKSSTGMSTPVPPQPSSGCYISSGPNPIYVEFPRFFPDAEYPPVLFMTIFATLFDSNGAYLDSKKEDYDLIHTDRACSSTLQIGDGKVKLKSMELIIQLKLAKNGQILTYIKAKIDTNSPPGNMLLVDRYNAVELKIDFASDRSPVLPSSKHFTTVEIEKHLPTYVDRSKKCVILVGQDKYVKVKIDKDDEDVPYFTELKAISDQRHSGGHDERFSAIPAECATTVEGSEQLSNVIFYVNSPENETTLIWKALKVSNELPTPNSKGKMIYGDMPREKSVNVHGIKIQQIGGSDDERRIICTSRTQRSIFMFTTVNDNFAEPGFLTASRIYPVIRASGVPLEIYGRAEIPCDKGAECIFWKRLWNC